jgi:hypothetical protein
MRGNPAIKAAESAGAEINAKVIWPNFDYIPGRQDQELKLSDYNDLLCRGRLEIVREQIERVLVSRRK